TRLSLARGPAREGGVPTLGGRLRVSAGDRPLRVRVERQGARADAPAPTPDGGGGGAEPARTQRASARGRAPRGRDGRGAVSPPPRTLTVRRPFVRTSGDSR